MLLVGTVLLCGCGGTSDRAPSAEATLDSTRDEVRRRPQDARLRLALAEFELDAGDAVAAEGSVRRARALGIPESDVAPLLAESLAMQGSVDSVLALTGATASQSPENRFAFAFLHASIQLPLRNVDRRMLRREWIRVHRLHAALGETAAPGRQAIRLSRRLDDLRRTEPIVREALEHYTCDRSPDTLGVTSTAIAPGRRTLQVGPTREFAVPSDAARVARDLDVVEIDAGTYRGDVAEWTQNGLLLRANGGRVVLDSGGRVAGDGAIWLIRGNDAVVEGIEFAGARSSRANGAGIRFMGRNLTVRNSVFHDNENGLMTWHDPTSDVLVEHCVFLRNGRGDGLTHNIYIGRQRSFTLRFTHTHAARGGQAVKSRAAAAVIEYNRIGGEADSGGNYLIDLPEGGDALVLGNELYKDALAKNKAAISISSDETAVAGRQLVVNNTMHNRLVDAVLVRNHGKTRVQVVNNVVTGAPASIAYGPANERGNRSGPGAALVDSARFDFRPLPDSPLIDAALTLAVDGGVDPVPHYEYAHPATGRARQRVGPLDIGAREFCGW